ncbi:glycoside hydrolase family 61 protein [Amylocarpus encephaloides]|uniref:AA9 family lytic polysaccharide monooxygenase n=1 Tax=Amylocarpus encephaloides TaxID=45428 RepID=A0A9P8C271_9HELO|nr:glycoside hydrolase family 61 protein [Amylocarpus encephaloides]
MKLIGFAGILMGVWHVQGHGGVWNYEIDGKHYDGYKYWSPDTPQTTPQRRWPKRDPIEDLNDPYLACNYDGTTVAPSIHAPIPAGGAIVAHYEKNFTIPGDTQPQPETWGHNKGPIMAYMAACNGPCTTIDPSSSPKRIWFKIFELGLINGTYGTGQWGSTAIYNGSPWTLTIPKNLKARYYLIRHEVINNYNSGYRTQWYMECAQLEVTGDGKQVPGEEYLVAFPGAYKESDPGYNFTFYDSEERTKFVIPGPKVWTSNWT